MKKTPTLLLGSAQFGWNMEKNTTFELLDAFYEADFRQVDAATNYPINKNVNDFRASETLIWEWLQANGVHDLKVMMKIGSLNNLRTPECNLSKAFLLMSLENYNNYFGKNLNTLMIHWDNRSDEKEISETIAALETIEKQGINIGLSGIQSPAIYKDFFKNKNIYIQLKHNVLQSDFSKYVDFFPEAKYITYGINAGGIKLKTDDYDAQSTLKIRGGDVSNQNLIFEKIENIIKKANENKDREPITSFFQIGMINAFYHEKTHGILIGNSSATQWKKTLDFYKNLIKNDYSDIYKTLT